jgi:hypothetical protein
MSSVLRLPRPGDKYLAGLLQPPAAEQVRESEGRVPLALARNENQRCQDRLRLLEAPSVVLQAQYAGVTLVSDGTSA